MAFQSIRAKVRRLPASAAAPAIATALIAGLLAVSLAALNGSRISLNWNQCFPGLAVAVICLLVMFSVAVYAGFREMPRIAWPAWYFPVYLLSLFSMVLAQYAAALSGRGDHSQHW